MVHDRAYTFPELYLGTFAAIGHLAEALKGVPFRQRPLAEALAVNDFLLHVYGGDVGERRTSSGHLMPEEASALVVVETLVDLFTRRM